MKISIIVPAYNVERYILQCLDSLRKQTLDDIEVIVVDDGSTDLTASLARNYIQDLPYFHFFTKNHTNLGDTRNYALLKARGKYITFVDGDDVLVPKACEILYRKAEQTQSEIVVGKVMRRREDNSLFFVSFLDHWFHYDKNYNFRENDSFLFNYPILNGKLFLREFLSRYDIMSPCLIAGQDRVFSFYANYYSKKIVVIPKVVYWWTIRQDENNRSLSQIFSAEIVQSRIAATQIIHEFCEKQNLCGLARENLRHLDTLNSLILKIRNFKEQQETFEYFQNFIKKIEKKELTQDMKEILSISYEDFIRLDYAQYLFINHRLELEKIYNRKAWKWIQKYGDWLNETKIGNWVRNLFW